MTTSTTSTPNAATSSTPKSVREGLATILAPYKESNGVFEKQTRNNDQGGQAVFYNPIQQFNRDLSILAILVYGEGALLEKEARLSYKRQHKRKKDKHQKGVLQLPSDEATSLESNNHNSKKRNSDTLDQDQTEEVGKKVKVEDFDADEEELELFELIGDAPEVEEKRRDQPDLTVSDNSKPQLESTPRTEETTSEKHKQIPFTILDALSATGLRALRYAKEIPFTTNIIANDLSPEAVKSIEVNIDHNDVRGVVHSHVGDARAYMYSKVGNERQHPPKGYVHRFDVIDLDPYGSAAPFLDASIQALIDGGLLCVTCTDAGVFASNGYPEKAYALYNGIPMKGPHSHEGGLRLILNAVASVAAKYGISIEPLLCLSIDFYARLFIRIHKQPKDVKLLAGTTMLVYNCDYGCGAWTTQTVARNQSKENRHGETVFKHSYAQAPTSKQFCEHCGSKMHLCGPMWAGPLHNPYFLQRILDKLPSIDKETYTTHDRIRGMLTLALEEDLNLHTTTTSSDSTTPTLETNSSPAISKSNSIVPRLDPSTIDNTPFFIMPTYLAKILHCTTPPEDALRGAILRLGYRVTRSHCKPGSFKTNTPWNVMWEIMLEWIRQKSPIKEGAVKENTPGWRILAGMKGTERKYFTDLKSDLVAKLEDSKKCSGLDDLRTLCRSVMWRLEHEKVKLHSSEKEEEDEVHTNSEVNPVDKVQDEAVKSLDEKGGARKIVFDAEIGREKPRGKLLRYQINPRANWGPMNRATGAG